jgi:DNA replication protein DnaC
LAFGSAAVEAGHRVRYYSAADLVDTLYRGLADNSVGKVIDGLLRYELIIVDEIGLAPPGRHRCPATVSVRRHRLRTPLRRRRLSLAIRSLGRFLPEHTTAVSMLDRLLHHCHVVVTNGTQTVFA